MYEQFLREVDDQLKRFGGALQPPASSESLVLLNARAKQMLGADVPESYITFLRLLNGLDFNSLVVYASEKTKLVGIEKQYIQSFVEMNLIQRDYEPMGKFLVLGESGVEIYVYEFDKSEYAERDRISLDVLERHPSFEEMIASAIRKRL